MNEITRKTPGIDFRILIDDLSEHSYYKHRRGSNFFTRSIVEINKESFPELPRDLDGFWETNDYISDTEYGTDLSQISTLTRVEKRERVTVTYEWVPVSPAT